MWSITALINIDQMKTTNNFKNDLTPMCALSMWGPSSVSSEAVMQLWDKLCKQVFLDRMALLALFLGWLKNLANLNIAKEAKFKSFFFFTCQHVKINPKKMLLALFLGWPKSYLPHCLLHFDYESILQWLVLTIQWNKTSHLEWS